MGTSYENRLGTSPEEGIKSPCVVSTPNITNIALSGEQTIDTVPVIAGDRVLVRSQTDSKENGIYDVSAGNWSRSKDFNQANDVISGVLVLDANSSIIYQAIYTGEYQADITQMTFNQAISYAFTSQITTETHTAVQDQTVFTLTNAYLPNKNNLIAYGNGVFQSKTSAFVETDGNTVTFTEGFNAGDVVDFLIGTIITSLDIPTLQIVQIDTATDFYLHQPVDLTVITKLKGYATVGDGGEGDFLYDATIVRSTADGVTIFDPTVTLVNQGTGSGTGCWTKQLGYQKTTTEIEDITNDINTSVKYSGLQIWNTTTNRPLWSVGSTDGAVWIDGSGATVHTPT